LTYPHCFFAVLLILTYPHVNNNAEVSRDRWG